MPLQNAAVEVESGGTRGGCAPAGRYKTDSLTEPITSNHRRRHGDGVHRRTVSSAGRRSAALGGTRRCNLQTARPLIGTLIKLAPFSTVGHLLLKSGHVIEYLIKAANLIDWPGLFFHPAEHLPQRVGGVGGVG